MSQPQDSNDDESFIVLGSTSRGTSLNMQFNGLPQTENSTDMAQVSEILNGLGGEASMAFKARFELADSPSPGSMMIASNIVSEDKSIMHLQKKFGELLDENLILKNTVKQNNDSMKEQFLLIASCQEDMMKTHKLHKNKFDETKELVERLRIENKKLKQDLMIVSQTSVTSSATNDTTDRSAAGDRSLYEFVASPDEDTMNKLTSQLELVERQRRQVIVDNEKLTWQKESLEHLLDTATKERDALQEKLRIIELHEKDVEHKYIEEINSLKVTVRQLSQNSRTPSTVGDTKLEIEKRDKSISVLESKLSCAQTDLKNAQLNILDLESIKLEYTRQKQGNAEFVKMYKEQIQDLQNRLREAQTTVFQPVRFSLSSEMDSTGSEYSSLLDNVKVYDKTLKHLSELLNNNLSGLSKNLSGAQEILFNLSEMKLDECPVDKVKANILELKKNTETQHSTTLNYVGQIRGTIAVFEGIFNDYKEVLKNLLSKHKSVSRNSDSVDALTAALVARGQELTTAEAELSASKERLTAASEELRQLRELVVTLQRESDERDALRAQAMLYKADFEAERESRQQLASDKDSLLIDMRALQRRNQELTEQLEEVRKINPNLVASAMKRRPSNRPEPSTTGNMVYVCPKCNAFSCEQYKIIEDHVEMCLDN